MRLTAARPAAMPSSLSCPDALNLLTTKTPDQNPWVFPVCQKIADQEQKRPKTFPVSQKLADREHLRWAGNTYAGTGNTYVGAGSTHHFSSAFRWARSDFVVGTLPIGSTWVAEMRARCRP